MFLDEISLIGIDKPIFEIFLMYDHILVKKVRDQTFKDEF